MGAQMGWGDNGDLLSVKVPFQSCSDMGPISTTHALAEWGLCRGWRENPAPSRSQPAVAGKGRKETAALGQGARSGVSRQSGVSPAAGCVAAACQARTGQTSGQLTIYQTPPSQTPEKGLKVTSSYHVKYPKRCLHLNSRPN